MPATPKSAGVSRRTTTNREAQLRIWLAQSADARQARLWARERSIPPLPWGTWEAGDGAKSLRCLAIAVSRESKFHPSFAHPPSDATIAYSGFPDPSGHQT
jgi:hypothetical protein